MAKRPTGEVIERERKSGRVFALRFRAYGRRHFVTLGGAEDGWTRQKAEAELRHVLADVERGLWAPGVARRRRGAGRSDVPRVRVGVARGAPRRAQARPRSPTTRGSSATTCCRSSTATACRRSPSPRSIATAR